MSFVSARTARILPIVCFESRTVAIASSRPARYSVFHPVSWKLGALPFSAIFSRNSFAAFDRAAITVASPQSACTSGKLCTACSPYNARLSMSVSSWLPVVFLFASN